MLTASRFATAPLALTLLSAALLLGACTKPAADTQKADAKPSTSSTNNLDAAPPKTSALKVSAITPKQGKLNVSRTSSATITAAQDSQVAALTGGAVTQVLAVAGQSVKAGDVVVQLDTSALRQTLESAQLQLQSAQINLAQTQRNTNQGDPQLQSALAAAQANFDKAQQDVTANRNLLSLGGISAADLKASEAALAQTQSALSLAKNNLTQNGQSGSGSLALLQNQVKSAQVSVGQAQENLTKASVRAPFSGTVASVSAKLGEYVNTGTAVFRLVDGSSLTADFNVSPSDAAALVAGSKLNFDYGGKTYLAVIKEGDRVTGSDRLVPLTTRLFGASASNLPVGGVGQMRYRVSLASGALLPSGAIQNDSGDNAVYLVGGDAAQRQTVKILAESQGQVAVSGVPSGAQVIYPVPPSLQDGASIKVGE
ncbi:HlyD family efflux transporter periplasmic adaptor subunit [Deinococcus psychrotolerans]|uniref:HlyD family efflux transporter periplasmic adaptor subunit n=1 Tax=Deinococcus psychrotolerans TaxID=2489213 RepID=A0A3G8Y8X2_9DEIO|nr:HlyD family efflux transporter periplasmic adaptor subunit [Deinococcus psychrotolerans]AZI41353.1 HlyD family efflux transporter periplasmic adaptor subunit [Deinococcus psychrotolerans]